MPRKLVSSYYEGFNTAKKQFEKMQDPSKTKKQILLDLLSIWEKKFDSAFKRGGISYIKDLLLFTHN